MRTVDPAQWSKKVVKPPLVLSRPWRYRVNVMTTFEQRMRSSFYEAMMDFLRNCSLEGIGGIVNMSNPKPVRWCYFVLLTGSLVGCLVVTSLNVAQVRGRPPLAVMTQAAPHPVQAVDFPAVALCSYNIVSRKELDSYARYLYSLQKNNTYSIESLKSNLMAFSGLIAAASQVGFDPDFSKYLAEVARETNVTNIIYKLSPKCKSMLARCSWRARRVRCQHLFASRITDVGYCCVFNARYSLEDKNNPPYRVNFVGEDSGLSVVIKENTDDFTFVRRTGEELEMLIFDGRQYPLVRAGVIRTYPLQRNASVFVMVKATVQHASDSLRFYTEAWRGCVLPPSEGQLAHYWAQCVAECRRKAVLALCQCTPHTKPVSNRNSNEVICSLEHMACLDKHKEKLSYFYPGEDVDESLSEEQADSVECLHCLPNCARLRYSARISTVPYGNLVKKAFRNEFVEGLNLENGTVVRIYFTSVDQGLYLVEINLRIYELISFLSSQWVLMIGMTVVTVVEFIYHCTIRWRHHYKRRWRRDNQLSKIKYWEDNDFYGQ